MISFDPSATLKLRVEHDGAPELTVLPTEEVISSGSTIEETHEDAVIEIYDASTIRRAAKIDRSLVGAETVFTSLDPSIATVDDDGNVGWVSDGTARITAVTGWDRKKFSIPVSEENPTPAEIFKQWVAGTLSAYTQDRIADLVDGLSPGAGSQSIFSGANRNANLFCADYVQALTAIARSTNTGWVEGLGLTAITPRHVLGCNHAPFANGVEVTWVTAAGMSVTRTIIASQQIGKTDGRLYLIDSDLPASITPMPLFPADLGNYIRNPKYRAPILHIDRSNWVRISGLTDIAHDIKFREPDPAFSGFYTYPLVGTSGKPVMIPVSGSGLALLSTFYSTTFGPSYHQLDWAAIVNALDVAAGVPLRANYLLQGNNLADDTAWPKPSSAAVPTVSGTLVTFPFAVDGGGEYCVIRQNIDASLAGVCTLSVELKAGSLSQIPLYFLRPNTGQYVLIEADLTDEWQRFSVTFTTVANGAPLLDIGYNNTFGLNGPAGTFYIRNVQLEPGSSATPYIPTTTTAVTSNNTGWLPKRADLRRFIDYSHELAGLPGRVAWFDFSQVVGSVGEPMIEAINLGGEAWGNANFTPESPGGTQPMIRADGVDIYNTARLHLPISPSLTGMGADIFMWAAFESRTTGSTNMVVTEPGSNALNLTNFTWVPQMSCYRFGYGGGVGEAVLSGLAGYGSNSFNVIEASHSADFKASILDVLRGDRGGPTAAVGINDLSEFIASGDASGPLRLRELILAQNPGPIWVDKARRYFAEKYNPINIEGADVWRSSVGVYQDAAATIPVVADSPAGGSYVSSWVANTGRKFVYDTTAPYLRRGYVTGETSTYKLFLPQARDSRFTIMVRMKLSRIDLETRYFYVNYSAMGISGSSPGQSLKALIEEVTWSTPGTGVVQDQVVTIRLERHADNALRYYLGNSTTPVEYAVGTFAADGTGGLSLQAGGYAGIIYLPRLMTSDEVAIAAAALEKMGTP